MIFRAKDNQWTYNCIQKNFTYDEIPHFRLE
jgi:hypothetical protein